MENYRCHCCGLESYENYIDSELENTPVYITYKMFKNVYKCSVCDHVYRDYSHVDLDKFYNEIYRIGYEPYPRPIREGFVNNIINLILPYINDCNTILEIGSGDGILADALAGKGKQVFCSEIDNDLRLKLEERYRTFGKYTEIPNVEKFDCVISTDVLEHIEHPSDYISKLDFITDKIIVQVPILREVNYQEINEWDGHFHLFTDKSIKNLFEKWNYKVEFIFNEYSLKRFAWNSEMIVVFKKQKQNEN